MRKQKQLMIGYVMICVLALFSGLALAQDAGKIDINQASTQELTQLKNIGPSYAERIVEFREQNGPFKSPEDIMLVKGIGTKIWELNKDRITVGN